ncbi:hypothetical protein DGMP_15980 [Desulfomarina profundi]|uniref:Uncharacterized protein n=1 Tax=Desulfomarina profundi TaxID=2772557 RepID=A0A8D5JP55_9BACT|nr:hypothetical protein DGMP_15980 [Desulfomarina profundi]
MTEDVFEGINCFIFRQFREKSEMTKVYTEHGNRISGGLFRNMKQSAISTKDNYKIKNWCNLVDRYTDLFLFKPGCKG